MKFERENDLEKATISYLDRTFKEYKWQVPISNRIIDLVGIDSENNLIGIEYKLYNWRKALEQARKNYISLDYIYICLPDGNYDKELFELAEKLGIGILLYDFSTTAIIHYILPKKNERKWLPASENIKNYILN